ncbi:unnamed protein product [Cylicocyclus nassatus]|uniref:Uncharacterized protein n=1 Tax=Cylicocyclus nassatus TaxID=53992 RepID=A0AA36DUN5_CYLNA|nr:unnamed protein product [Cylicocyclus nassatus]
MFRRFLNEENLPNVVPMNDAPTRWSSTYFMLCDFLAAMPAVERLLSTCDMLPFENGEIRILKAMRVFLQPFQAMTNQVCYQTSCCSMFISVGKLVIAKTEGIGYVVFDHNTKYYQHPLKKLTDATGRPSDGVAAVHYTSEPRRRTTKS